jgi:hypothetical protein
MMIKPEHLVPHQPAAISMRKRWPMTIRIGIPCYLTGHRTGATPTAKMIQQDHRLFNQFL